MWFGSIRLRIRTKDAPNAGTDSLVTATIVRDGVEIKNLKLDYSTENDLERGAVRNYDYIGPAKLTWDNDQTPKLPDGIGQTPMPYPSYGIEFSNGLNGHLKIRLKIHGDDMWIKDNVDLYIREIRQKAEGIDTLYWEEDSNWTFIGTWDKDFALSTDSDEGINPLNLNRN